MISITQLQISKCYMANNPTDMISIGMKMFYRCSSCDLDWK